jgi:hypothetical protein
VTIQQPTQATSCCNLLAPVRQLSSNSRSARMSFSQVQRVFIVEHYLASRSYLTCQNESRYSFPDSPVPNKLAICRLVNRFRDTGSVQDRNRSGRPSVFSDDSLDDIRQILLPSPPKSLRKYYLQSWLSYGSVYKATKVLKLHPYRVHVMHELKEPDKGKLLQYCRWFTHFIRGGTDILDKVFYIDEAWFHLSGSVNSQNSRIWNAANPHIFHERPLHSLKSRSMVCCLSKEDNWSHFLQWNDNSWTLPGTDYEFNFPFESWRTRLLVSARWDYGSYSKFNNVGVQRVLWWSHYFSKLVAPSITGSIATGFLSLGVFEGERVQKQPAHIWRIETKYWAVHFKTLQKLFTGCHQT